MERSLRCSTLGAGSFIVKEDHKDSIKILMLLNGWDRFNGEDR